MEEVSWCPDDFRCPISLEVMTDPVILPSGHTFERRSIQRWLDGGHLTCPVTNLPLPPSPPLIPNHALRRLIAAVSPPPPSPEKVRDCQGAEPPALSSVSGMLRLAKSGPAGRRLVLESGAVAAVLLRRVAGGDEVAARALVYLSLAGSARAVEVLGLLAKSRECRQELSRIPDMVPVLCAFAGSGNARAVDQGLVVLNWICSESNRLAKEAIKLGAFQLCEALVKDDNCKIAKNAVELARTLEEA